MAYCLLPIAYCLLPMPGWMHSAAWMHTASECILPLNAFGRRMHSAADCIRRPMRLAWGGSPPPRPRAPLRGPTPPAPPSHPGRAAECIGRRMLRRPNAFRGSMHSEAVCNQARMQSSPNAINLPIAYCLLPIPLAFVQVKASIAIRSGTDLANFEAVRLVRDLARRMRSSRLMELAQRMVGNRVTSNPLAMTTYL